MLTWGDSRVMTIEADAVAQIKLHGHEAPQSIVDALVQAIRVGDEQKILELDRLLQAVELALGDGQGVAASALQNAPDHGGPGPS